QPAVNTVVVGKETGLFLYEMVSRRLVDPKYVHLVGFSLGAQIMHTATQTFTKLIKKYTGVSSVKVGRITGLDPAARHFQGHLGAFLNREGAEFVDVIHTSVVDFGGNYVDSLQGKLGMSDAVGHVDFYPNAGKVPQPQC